MCGRYLLTAPVAALTDQFGLAASARLIPRYNIAPGTPVALIKATPEGRILTLAQWGLVPSWAKDPAMGGKLANARSETVAEKPSFRAPFRRHRCLIPADGFYEWQARSGAPKQPFLFRAAAGGTLAFAGLYEQWESPDGCLDSCTILTTAANAFMAPVHDRMPVILAAADFDLWLDPEPQVAARLQALLRPAPEDLLLRIPVGPRVGNVRNDDPGLIEALDLGDPGRLLDA
jgi:putative SOS response-associated peptidase YedK